MINKKLIGESKQEGQISNVPPSSIRAQNLTSEIFPFEWFEHNPKTGEWRLKAGYSFGIIDTLSVGGGIDIDGDDVVTATDIIDGFDLGGGTTTPDVPVIVSIEPYLGAMKITLDHQPELTNFDHYELQISSNDSTWYSLGTGTDWKGVLGEYTEYPGELCMHINIPSGGTTALPAGLLLYYRARRATTAGVKSNWSASASATTEVIGTSDVAGYAVTAYKLDALARGQHGVFLDTFLEDAGWTTYGGTGTVTVQTGVGICGGNVVQLAGYVGRRIVSELLIPFDTSKIYRIRVRARRTATTDALTQKFYMGVYAYDANKAYLDSTWMVCNNRDASAWTLNEWQVFTGWVKGRIPSGGSESGEHLDPTDPCQLHESASYMRLVYLCNYNGGPVGNVMQIDEISIDVFDEDELYRTYVGINVDGTIAANKVVANSIAANAVTADAIAANAVIADKIAANAVVASKIGAGEVSATHIAAGAITTTKLAASAVEADKIAAGAIVTSKIYVGAVSEEKLAALAVTADKLAALAVTEAKLAASSVTEGKLGALAVTEAKLAALAVTEGKIASAAVTGDKIANGIVSPYKLTATCKSQHGVYLETFEEDKGWTTAAGSGTVTIESGVGQCGGKVVQIAGYARRETSSGIGNYIPYDRTKLYRIRVRVRRTATTDSALQRFYMGVFARSATGSYLDAAWTVASNENAALWTLNEWQTFTGWLSGVSAGASESGEHPDATDPALLNVSTSYFSLIYHCNYNDGPAGNIMQIDEIAIDIFDEDSIVRAYLGLAEDGTILANKVIASSILAESITAEHFSVATLNTLLLKAATAYIGYYGTGDVDDPDEGDRVLYIDGDELSIQEYTNGDWTAMKGLKIGGALSGLFLSALGACGWYNSQGGPGTGTEFLPHPDFRIFAFENNYQDQYGVDDWVTKTDLAFDSTKKFGTYSLRASSTMSGLLASPTAGTFGGSQAFGAWVYFSASGTATATGTLTMMAMSGTYDQVYINTRHTNGSAVIQIGASVVKNSVTVYNAAFGTISNGWHYIGGVYDSSSDILYVTVDGTIYNTGVLGGTWYGGSASGYFFIRPKHNYVYAGITYSAFFDELLFYWDKYLDPEIFVQHYTHNVTWTLDRALSDCWIRPDYVNDGRLLLLRQANDYHQVLTPIRVANPTTGWLATKTTGWTADRFTAASGGMEVAFSSLVSAGTKAVVVNISIVTTGGTVYARPAGDDTYATNTPEASQEYHCMIGYTDRIQTTLWLDSGYRCEIAVSNTGTDIYVSYPTAEIR
jgi:hypothetical protein